jgi:hypothetical protein
MSAQDRLEVMELMARYQQCEDAGDAEGYAGCFTPDGVAEWANGKRTGREELREWMEEFVRGGVMGANPARMRHFLSMPHIYEGDGQRCKAGTYLAIFVYAEAGQVTANSLWTYLDDIVKYEGEWLFEKRFMQIDLRSGADSASAGQTPRGGSSRLSQ